MAAMTADTARMDIARNASLRRQIPIIFSGSFISLHRSAALNLLD
jgi:hypothetical protein